MRTHVSGKRAKESACSRLNERQASGMGGITLAALIAPTLHIPASIQDDSADHAFPTYRARYATGLPDRLPHAQDHQAHRHWGHHPRWDGTQTLSGYFSSFFPYQVSDPLQGQCALSFAFQALRQPDNQETIQQKGHAFWRARFYPGTKPRIS